MYDVKKFDRDQQIGCYNKAVAAYLDAIHRCLEPTMAAAGQIEMPPEDIMMGIYYLQGIVTEQDHVIRYLLARDNTPRQRWWDRLRRK